MDADTGSKGRTARLRRQSQSLFLWLVVVLPVAAAFPIARDWGEGVNPDSYAAVAQIIATLFIAITVEFFAHLPARWRGAQERFSLILLLAASWVGLFASIKGFIDGGSAWTSGLAGAGLIAASGVVSLSFAERLRMEGKDRQNGIALLFLLPPVILLVLL